MSFPNPDNYARDCDCGTAGANTTPPPANIELKVENLLSSIASPANAGSGNIYAKYNAPDLEESQPSVSGNIRGIGAVDLQQIRDDVTKVASGIASVIAGGRNNKASGTYYSTVSGGINNSAVFDSTTVGGGLNNTAAGNAATISGGGSNFTDGDYSTISGGSGNSSHASYATVCGGSSNDASNDYATVCGGFQNAAGGLYSVVSGGNSNSAGGEYSAIIGGYGAVTNKQGMIANASGFFATAGDAQAVSFVLRTVTTTNSPTNVFLDGTSGSYRLTIPSGKILACTVNVSGIKSDGSLGVHYIKKVMIKNVGGTTSLVGTVSTVGTDVEDAGASAWDITITADNTNDALDIKVTGAASTTIRWVAVVQGLEIAYGT
jgi:hypothetical protein